jgi:hypothetical protein
MILERLKNDGRIPSKYKLKLNNNQQEATSQPSLFYV